MANGFEKRLLSPGCRLTPGGLLLDVRLPWYRALPLSVVEVAGVTIDGAPVPPERISFELNGRRFRLAELRELVDEWWFVLDSAFLHVEAPGLKGDRHEVELTLNLYPPYIHGMTWVTRARRDLRAA